VTDPKRGDEGAPIQAIEDEAIEENPDDQTRRETFELDLMEAGRSNEGGSADLEDERERRGDA